VVPRAGGPGNRAWGGPRQVRDACVSGLGRNAPARRRLDGPCTQLAGGRWRRVGVRSNARRRQQRGPEVVRVGASQQEDPHLDAEHHRSQAGEQSSFRECAAGPAAWSTGPAAAAAYPLRGRAGWSAVFCAARCRAPAARDERQWRSRPASGDRQYREGAQRLDRAAALQSAARQGGGQRMRGRSEAERGARAPAVGLGA